MAVRRGDLRNGDDEMGQTRTMVSLFAGAGGMDIGLENAGWNLLAQIEMDHDCAETLRIRSQQTESNVRILESRIEDVNPSELMQSLDLRMGDLGLLAGGPPCQPFTTHGLRRANKDPRAASLFPSYFRYVAEFRPQSLLIENVDGMLSAALRHRPLSKRGKGFPPLAEDEQKGSFLRWFLEHLRKLGYTVSWGVMEAADFGVPQLRQRAILIGVCGDEPCYLPKSTHGRPGLPPYRTLRQGLKGVRDSSPVQPLSARKRKVYRLIPPGGNWRNLRIETRKRTMGAAYRATGGKGGWWRRLSWDDPAPTVLGMPDHSSTGLIHPGEVRCLSVNECAALQSFPPGTMFTGRPRSQYQQIGNAVPPALAEHLGRQIMQFLEGFREPTPAPPEWRRASANRRIGTHGWTLPSRRRPSYHLIVKVREDHIWANAAVSVAKLEAFGT